MLVDGRFEDSDVGPYFIPLIDGANWSLPEKYKTMEIIDNTTQNKMDFRYSGIDPKKLDHGMNFFVRPPYQARVSFCRMRNTWSLCILH